MAEKVKKPVVILVYQRKGGVGKTTFTVQIGARAAAGQLSSVRKRVLLVDLDSQQNLSRIAINMQTIQDEDSALPPIHPDFDPNLPDHADWGGRTNSVDLYYANAVVPYPTAMTNMDIIPADGQLLANLETSGLDTDADSVTAAAANIQSLFDTPEMAETYDLILVDCPPGKTMVTLPMLKVATHIIIPFEPEALCFTGTSYIWNLIEKVNKKRAQPLKVIGVVPNKVQLAGRNAINNHRAYLELTQVLKEFLESKNASDQTEMMERLRTYNIDPDVIDQVRKGGFEWARVATPWSIHLRTSFKLNAVPNHSCEDYPIRYDDPAAENEMRSLMTLVDNAIKENAA